MYKYAYIHIEREREAADMCTHICTHIIYIYLYTHAHTFVYSQNNKHAWRTQCREYSRTPWSRSLILGTLTRALFLKAGCPTFPSRKPAT